MKIKINKIKIADRLRKEIRNIDELAADIRKHGLISPIAVIPLGNGEYKLLAGFRRLRAMELNGETEIDVKIFSVSDAESAIKIEHSENEQREPLTFSEKMEYAKLIEEIETEKARERKSMGGKGGVLKNADCGSNIKPGKSRDIIGAKIGMSGNQYNRAKYIAANAPQEIIDELDYGKRKISQTYHELRDKQENKFRHEEQNNIPDPILALELKEFGIIFGDNEPDNISPETEIKELQDQIKKERIRADIAESKLASETELRKNEAKHYNTIIEMLKKQLNRAHKIISELEKKYESDEKTS
jgi:ParB family chromosome partitioning protein